MYESFFGLSRRPFGAAPDPGGFVDVGSAGTVLAGLRRCVEDGQGIALLTAPAGLGKTLLCRKLLADLQATFVPAFLPTADFPTRRALLQAVLHELGRPLARLSEPELRLELATALREIRGERQGVVLAVDEAHSLGPRLLEEIRGWTNLFEDARPLVRVLLCGHLALEETLVDPALAALGQRIGCHQVLEPLSRSESADYVTRRLAWAGADTADLFTPEALSMICHASDGNPRCLNQLCDHCLLLAGAAEEKPITAATVRQALDELKRLALAWNDLPAEPTATERPSPPADAAIALPTDDAEPASAGVIEFGATAESETAEPAGACIEIGGAAEGIHPATPVWDDGRTACRTGFQAVHGSSLEEVQETDGLETHSAECHMPSGDGEVGPSPAQYGDEDVVDRYARLDAGWDVPAVERPPRRAPLPSDAELPELAELRRDEERIEQCESRSPRPAFRRAGEPPHDPAEPVFESAAPEDAVPLAPPDDETAIESVIAAMVFECGEDVRHALAGEFDVVEPPLDDAAEPERENAMPPLRDADPAEPSRRFATLFSRLRRRQLAGER